MNTKFQDGWTKWINDIITGFEIGRWWPCWKSNQAVLSIIKYAANLLTVDRNTFFGNIMKAEQSLNEKQQSGGLTERSSFI